MKRTPIKSRSISPRSRLIARAESAVNAFVRARDAGRPCISCFEYKPLTAGHYRSTRAAPELRFDAKNIHGQCSRCNIDLAGNREGYREGLIERFGHMFLAWLDGPHEAKHYTRDELERIRVEYNQKLTEFKDTA